MDGESHSRMPHPSDSQPGHQNKGSADSDDDRSVSSEEPTDSQENDSLFLNSTISRDDTLSRRSKKQELLAKLKTQQDSRIASNTPLQLGSSPLNPHRLSQQVPKFSFQVPHSLPRPHPDLPSLELPQDIDGPGTSTAFQYPTSKRLESAPWRLSLTKLRGDISHTSSGIVMQKQKLLNNSEHLEEEYEEVLPARASTRCDSPSSLTKIAPSTSEFHTNKSPVPKAATEVTKMAKRASDVPEILEAINDNTSTAEESRNAHSSAVDLCAISSDYTDQLDSLGRTTLPDHRIAATSQDIFRPISNEKPENMTKPGLAEALSIVAENYLSIDILDQSKSVPQYVSYLLDTIQLLESQVQYYQAEEAAELPCDSPEDKKVPSSTSPITVSHVPRKQLLHRIFCGDPTHKHKTGISEDQPTQRAGHSGVLETKMSISNLETYLGLHPDICFIVFKEYNCATGQNPSILRQRNSYGPNSQSASSRRERIRIISPVLQRALRQVAEYSLYSPGPHNEDTREIDAPYLFLYHHRQKLAALVENDAYSEVLKTLLDFVEESYKEEYDEAEALFARNRVTPSHFSKLFKPNQVVVSRQDADTLTAAVLRYHPEMAGDKTIFSGWTWIFDGSYLRRSIWRGKMDQVFEDETSIADLPIHPADLARNEDIKKLEARGERFWELKNQSYLCYTGWNKTYDHHYTHKRFMIDVATYYLMHQSTSKDNTEISDNTIDTWPRKISRREELPLKAAILLPSSTYGFDLEEKNWVSLWVDQFHPIHWNKSAFERLVLEQKTKEMIHALVNVQTSTSNMDDIIVGKGNGLIVLLHGSPGTGKTLTAESVAEIAEKPLYRVTCGDIGVEASKVEKYLETVMYLGKLWDCILLLDEADVFLEERTMADLQRNSLVSVFLRILEYYEGIIILTSNRVGTFDEAFKSRIQVAIHYDNLTKKSRKQIWRNFFNMIEDSSGEDVNMPELERRLDELASEEMNGRQIRNALLTARQLAKHRNERLDWPHLSQVMKTSAAFNKYLKAVKGHSDEQWAREEQLR